MGPYILWPEKARKSQSSACTSTFMWGTDCAPSTSTRASWAWAIRAISFTSFTVPRTLETCVTATILVRGSHVLSTFCEVERPVVLDGHVGERAALPGADELPGHDVAVVLHTGEEHDVSLAECASPHADATRFIDSVVPRVKTISAGRAALRSLCVLCRDSSKAAVASSPRVCRALWTFALPCS